MAAIRLHKSISADSFSAKSRPTSRQRAIKVFMCSMSRMMRSTRSASGRSESMPRARRMRVSGERRSWEIPASRVVRLASRASMSSPMRLNSRASVASSVGPVSGSGAGRSPLPMRWVALARLASGRISQWASRADVSSVTAVPASRMISRAAEGCTATRLAGKPTCTRSLAPVASTTGSVAQYQTSPSFALSRPSRTACPARADRAASRKWK